MRGVIVLLCGCGRFAFDPQADAAAIGPDALVACNWSPPVFTTPTLRADLSSANLDVDPYLVPGDPLTIFFGSGATGDIDIFEAHRPSVDALFETRVGVASLNTAGVETGLVVGRGALHGYFVAGQGSTSIYEVTRTTVTDEWTITRRLAELDLETIQYDPWPSPDDLTLHFTAGPSISNLTIYEATRPTTSSPWGNVTALPLNIPGAKNSSATLTGDQLVIVWSAPGSVGNTDLFYAVRSSVTEPFGSSQILPLSSPGYELEPSLREDGCELFFAYTASGSNTSWDIYSVTLLP